MLSCASKIMLSACYVVTYIKSIVIFKNVYPKNVDEVYIPHRQMRYLTKDCICNSIQNDLQMRS